MYKYTRADPSCQEGFEFYFIVLKFYAEEGVQYTVSGIYLLSVFIRLLL